MAADHQRAPCSCPESGCAFVGSRAMLLDHFTTGHQRPAVTVPYGRSSNLGFSLSHRWHVLVGEEHRSVFLVSLGPLGAATAVSLVCVRPDGEAEAAPRFWCKLSVERPGNDMVLMATPVSSSTLATGAPALGQGMFLAVPQELLSGDTLSLSVRIDLIPPAAGAANEVDYTTGQHIEEGAVNSVDPDYIDFMEGPKEPLKANSKKDDNEEEEDKDDEEDDEEEVEEYDDEQPMIIVKHPRRDDGPERASKKNKKD